ncbi:hypothetical protein [Nocardioides sp. SYSU DS0651]|uniref:hypothetical protein n=1 Tax=Nocardioides sp. SYSU DS0651 TaxID=3415955 RepID=UPI003F4C1CC5
MALGTAAASVAAVVAVTQVVGSGNGGAPPGPVDRSSEAPTATTTRGTDHVTGLAALVDGAEARIVSMAVTTGDPEGMATVWQVEDGRAVLALTDDGYATRTLLEVPTTTRVHQAGRGRFVLVDGLPTKRVRVVASDGTTTPVTVSPSEAPLAEGEVPIVTGTQSRQIVGVATDGTAHRVPTPKGMVDVRSLGGRLVGIAFDRTAVYHWTDDGGATWDARDLGVDTVFASPLESPPGHDHAVVEGADGATLFPLVALHTASAGDPTEWTRTALQDRAVHWTVDGGWVDADGVRLLLTGEPAGRRRGPSEAGVFRVVDGELEKVSGLGDVRKDGSLQMLLVEYADGPVVWIAGEGHEVWRTTDGGVTWEPFRAR